MINLRENSNMTNTGLLTLTDNNPQLTYLDLDGCSQFSTKALENIGKCSQLQTLILPSTQLTDAVLIEITKKCTRLQNLQIGMTQITDAVLPQIIENCPDLQYLDLSDCNSLSEAAIAEIQNRRPNLEISHFCED